MMRMRRLGKLRLASWFSQAPLRLQVRCLHGQRKGEGGALVRLAGHLDQAAMGFDDLPDDVQPEPQAPERAVGDRALEPLEDPGQIRGLDPDPVVADHQRPTAGFLAYVDLDGLAGPE